MIPAFIAFQINYVDFSEGGHTHIHIYICVCVCYILYVIYVNIIGGYLEAFKRPVQKKKTKQQHRA
jgi:hypothetical protein